MLGRRWWFLISVFKVKAWKLIAAHQNPGHNAANMGLFQVAPGINLILMCCSTVISQIQWGGKMHMKKHSLRVIIKCDSWKYQRENEKISFLLCLVFVCSESDYLITLMTSLIGSTSL